MYGKKVIIFSQRMQRILFLPFNIYRIINYNNDSIIMIMFILREKNTTACCEMLLLDSCEIEESREDVFSYISRKGTKTEIEIESSTPTCRPTYIDRIQSAKIL